MMPEDKWNNYQILKGLTPEYVQALEDRFWPKVNVGRPDECWEWQAVTQPAGYGKIGVGSEHQLAHRVAYELFVGPIPTDKPCVLHHCDNPPCVNLRHLFVGTIADNNLDKLKKGRAVGAVGVENGNSKLFPDAVRDIRNNYERGKRGGKNTYHFAEKYDVSVQVIIAVLNGDTWTHVN